MPAIIPIKELKDTSKISDLVHTSSEPVYVTKNGYGDMVLMSMETFEELTRRYRIYSSLASAEKDIADGKVRPARDALRELREKYAI